MTFRRGSALRLLGFALLVASGAALGRLAEPAPAGKAVPIRATCGFDRWPVKTLADPAARSVNYRPRPTTVGLLRRRIPTGSYTRAGGVERTTYRIRARLVEAKYEVDQDFHLVVADLRHPSQTMIVEFPASNCTRHSRRRRHMVAARAAFIRACGLPSASSFTALTGRATITGVGFFDSDHGQSGVAPNAIELHPVLSFTHARCT